MATSDSLAVAPDPEVVAEAALERPVVFSEALGTVYRASGLGGCRNALVAARAGYDAVPPPATLQGVFQRGHEAEEVVAAKLGDEIRNRQETVELRISVNPSIIVRGHLDGRVGHRTIAEIKSQDQQHWDMFERYGWERGFFPQYKWQVSVCMLATGCQCMLIRFNRETEEWAWSRVKEPFYSHKEVIERVMAIEELSHSPLPQVCEWKKWGCGYCHLFADPPWDHDDDLAELAQEYIGAVQVMGQIKARVDELKARIERASWKDKIKLDTGVSVTSYERTSTSFDYKRMAEDGIDLAPYQKETTYRSLRVYERAVDEKGGVPGQE